MFFLRIDIVRIGSITFTEWAFTTPDDYKAVFNPQPPVL